MSRARERVTQLTGIRDLHALAERVAEAGAWRLARSAEDQAARYRAEGESLAAMLDDWQVVLSARRLDPLTMTIHARAVTAQNEALAQVRMELTALEGELDGARQEHRRSQAGHRCAEDLLMRARRREARLREEKILAQRDDASTARR